jgi:hypothetical protein
MNRLVRPKRSSSSYSGSTTAVGFSNALSTVIWLFWILKVTGKGLKAVASVRASARRSRDSRTWKC